MSVLDELVDTIERELTGDRTLRRLLQSAQKRRAFALDLAFIALGCRCAWLIDAVVVADPEKMYGGLLRTLRQREPIFNGVEHFFCSQQSFFVNCQLLGTTLDVSFVLLAQEAQLLTEPPPDVLRVLANVPQPIDLSPATAIPLAGVLLGYPVAYVPTEGTAYLAQTALDVYACTVRAPNWVSAHTLVKFSCPAVLAEAYPARLSSTHIVAELERRFGARVAELGLTMAVEHTTEMLDRVAL